VILAIVLSSVAIVLSVTVPLVLSDRTLRNSFNALEQDFEELQDTVRSALGRVSRLKRSMQESPTNEPGPDSASNTEGGPGLSSRQLDIQRKILSRRHQ